MQQEIKRVRDADVRGKRVIVHTDFDVPLKNGAVADDSRIKAALPTIELLRAGGVSHITLISKLGRPGGKVVEELRMAPVAKRLAELIDMQGIELRENLRFDPREETNDENFAKELAGLGDVFVNEAFADSHRTHASIVGIPKFLPSYMGLRFEEEVKHMQEALQPPQKSLAIIGGAKFETKQPLVETLVKKYGTVVLGGALANDLLKSRGLPVGASLISEQGIPSSLAQNDHIQQPLDVVTESAPGVWRQTQTGDVRHDERIVDVGIETATAWAEQIAQAEFVVWNGPLGIYEQGYTAGTDALASALANCACKALIGGGDTAAALKKFTFDPSRIFISTGGGAMLHFLAEGTLPGFEALRG